MDRQVDDLPSHALGVYKQTMELMAEVFPSLPRQAASQAFVRAYFRAEGELKNQEGK